MVASGGRQVAFIGTSQKADERFYDIARMIEMLISVFLFITAPVSAHKAGLHRKVPFGAYPRPVVAGP